MQATVATDSNRLKPKGAEGLRGFGGFGAHCVVSTLQSRAGVSRVKTGASPPVNDSSIPTSEYRSLIGDVSVRVPVITSNSALSRESPTIRIVSIPRYDLTCVLQIIPKKRTFCRKISFFSIFIFIITKNLCEEEQNYTVSSGKY